MWRQLLLFAPKEQLSRCALKQITMGGEAVTQDLLDNLKQTFPTTRIVHIYASTELGRILSVTDGRAGFPAHYLNQPPESGIEFRIEGDELVGRLRR